MKQFWLTFFGSIFGVLVGGVLVALLAALAFFGIIATAVQNAEAPTTAIPRNAVVLELDLRVPRFDQPARSNFFFAAPLSTVEVVQAFERAETDERVAGVFVRANEFFLPPAQAEELRTAIDGLKSAGKFVTVHAQGFEGTGMSNYFGVSNADEVWMQGTSFFSPSGFSTETLFFGGMIERFGARAEYVQFREYKNAANIYTESDFTEPHREALLGLLGSLYDLSLIGVARDRGRDAEDLRDIVESGPYTADEALKAGLVDQVGHVQAARAAALGRAGANAALVSVEDYAREPAERRRGSGPMIALIEAQGPVVTGLGATGFGGGDMIGSDRVAEAIDAAIEDDDVRVILFRIDTAGGSPVASDQIHDAMSRAREAGKPVVVSMGDVAASAGYYIAAGADHIVANPSTITGSIGVLAGKLVLDGAYNQVGLNLEALAVGGEYALAYTAAESWNGGQRAAFERLIGSAYADFKTVVEEGRGLSPEQVEEIARGRVWTGVQALERGLVDELGGFRAAVAAAREIAGDGDDDAPLPVRRYPRRPSALDAFQDIFGMTADTLETVAALNALMELPEVRAALAARREAAAGPVRYQAPDAEQLVED